MSTPAGPLLEHLFRHQAGRIVSYLTRALGAAHLDLAEESVQNAMLRALQTWPYQGVPENAAAWLFRVAHNSALDAGSPVKSRTRFSPISPARPSPFPTIPISKNSSAMTSCV